MLDGVILVEVGRNLNRAVRTCYSFGVQNIYCLRCTGEVKGNLYSASGQVAIRTLDSLDQFDPEEVLALEVTPTLPSLQSVPVDGIRFVAIGGESTTLRGFPRMARIHTQNSLCLTTEAALAIALYHLGGG